MCVCGNQRVKGKATVVGGGRQEREGAWWRTKVGQDGAFHSEAVEGQGVVIHAFLKVCM